MATPPPPAGSPYGAPHSYGQQPGAYQQPGPYDQPGPYGAPNPYGRPGSPYGQPGPYVPQPPQAPYGGSVPPQGGYGYPEPQSTPMPPQPGWAAPNGPSCRFCGASPAVDVSVRAHRGLIWLMTFRELKGPFCRTCGTAAVRDLSGQTLVQGWWGLLSSVITPITLLINLVAYKRIKALPESTPHPQGRRMDPGKPLMQRPHAIGFAVPAVALVLLLVLVLTGSGGSSADIAPPGSPAGAGIADGDYAVAGQCVQNVGTDTAPDLHIVTCGGGAGIYLVEKKLYGTTDASACPSDASQTYTHKESTDDFVLCLKPATGN